jgi:glycosyltransferase involved in cell wall biosynthesis
MVRAAAARDERITALLKFVPDGRVAELHGACDAAVLTRTDGGTSGALVLALSLGLPVVAFRAPAYAALVGDTAGWLVEAQDADALAEALAAGAADPEAVEKGEAARRKAETFSWSAIGEQTAQLLWEVAA